MSGIKLTQSEVNNRIQNIYNLRYNSEEPMSQKEWVEYCHKTYGDKSEKTYCKYWNDAKEKYEEAWREKLSKQLDPAVDKLIELLSNNDPKIKQRAIDQVFKYTGNDINKIEAQIEGVIKVQFGGESTENEDLE